MLHELLPPDLFFEQPYLLVMDLLLSCCLHLLREITPSEQGRKYTLIARAPYAAENERRVRVTIEGCLSLLI